MRSNSTSTERCGSSAALPTRWELSGMASTRSTPTDCTRPSSARLTMFTFSQSGTTRPWATRRRISLLCRRVCDYPYQSQRLPPAPSDETNSLSRRRKSLFSVKPPRFSIVAAAPGRLRELAAGAIISRSKHPAWESQPCTGVVMSSELSYMPATELAQAIRSRQVSSVEVTQHFYERIGRLDSRLNSYLALCQDQALADARGGR